MPGRPSTSDEGVFVGVPGGCGVRCASGVGVKLGVPPLSGVDVAPLGVLVAVSPGRVGEGVAVLNGGVPVGIGVIVEPLVGVGVPVGCVWVGVSVDGGVGWVGVAVIVTGGVQVGPGVQVGTGVHVGG